MTPKVCIEETTRASALTKRELRTLTKRLANSEREELRAVARALDKAIAGEPFSPKHHDGDDYDPARCPRCQADLWVFYAIAVAFPQVTAGDLALFTGLHGLSDADVDAAVLAIQNGDTLPPDVRFDWLVLRDRQCEDLDTARADLEPGCWYRDARGRWVRDFGHPDPDPDAEVEALLASVAADHGKEICAFIAARSPFKWLAADPALLDEILGSDPRKARTLKRASLRKGFDSSWLL